jgi:hypothetical protein
MRCCASLSLLADGAEYLLTLSKIPKGLARLPRIPYFGILLFFCAMFVRMIYALYCSIVRVSFGLCLGYQIERGRRLRAFGLGSRLLDSIMFRCHSLRMMTRVEVLIARVL